MRKQFTVLNLGLSVLPFAFYELEGPFGIISRYSVLRNGNDPNQLSYPIELLNEKSEIIDYVLSDPINKHRYLCLYNRETGYSIGYIAPMFINSGYHNLDSIRFFQGKRVLSKSYEEQKRFCQERAKNHESNLKALVDKENLKDYPTSKVYNDFNKYRIKNDIPIRKVTHDGRNCYDYSDLNLYISNLKQSYINDKSNFEMSIKRTLGETGWKDDYTDLKFYFVKEKPSRLLQGSKDPLEGCKILQQSLNGEIVSGFKLSSTFIMSFRSRIENGANGVKIYDGDKETDYRDLLERWLNSKKEKALVDPNKVDDIEKQINLFNKSNILALYTIIKDKSNNNLVFWGLAQDKNDLQRKFHWITVVEE